MPDVAFYEAFEEESEQLARFIGDSFTASFTWKTIQEQGDRRPPARIVSIRTQSVVPTDWAGSLDGILARATGHDHLTAYRAATGAEIAYGHLPLYAHRSVAEHALMMWLALGRRLPVQQRQFATFHRDGLTGCEFESKRLLVVGVGKIGSEVVRIGRGLDMHVQGVDIVRRCDDLPYVDVDEALPDADVVVCAMNLTPENTCYFDYARLSRIKSGAIFVNIARGEQSPAIDLLRLLEEGRLAGVGLDVFADERPLAVALRRGHPPTDAESLAVLTMAQRDDAILTPHNAFNTREAVERKSAQSVEQILHMLEHGAFKWPIP
jgi:D-lactate dehydrogenase